MFDYLSLTFHPLLYFLSIMAKRIVLLITNTTLAPETVLLQIEALPFSKRHNICQRHKVCPSHKVPPNHNGCWAAFIPGCFLSMPMMITEKWPFSCFEASQAVVTHDSSDSRWCKLCSSRFSKLCSFDRELVR